MKRGNRTRQAILLLGIILFAWQGFADVTASNFKLTGPNNGGVTLSWTVSGSAGGGMFGGMFYANGTYNVAVTRGTSSSQSASSRTLVGGETSGAYMTQTGNSGYVTDTPPATGQTYYYWLHYAPYSIIDDTENFFTYYLTYNGSMAYCEPILSASCIGPVSVFVPAPAPKKLTVTFNSNDGNGDTTEQEFEKGVSQALKKNGFSRNGYEFQGWSTTEDGGVGYEDEQEVSIDADLTLYAVWKKNKLQLTASDGTVPGGIEVKWTDDGTEQYALYRALSEDGPFTNIATVATNVYFDTSVEWGQPYWYVVETSRSESDKDEGVSGVGNAPQILKIDVSKLWLQSQGGMKQIRLTWNEWDTNVYRIAKLTFKTETESCSIDHPENVSEISLDDWDMNRHGEAMVEISWGIEIKHGDSFEPLPDSPLRATNCKVAVYFDKYEEIDGVPNWFRYWHDDNAIRNASAYMVPEVFNESAWDGLFRYSISRTSQWSKWLDLHNDSSLYTPPIGCYPKVNSLTSLGWGDMQFEMDNSSAASSISYSISNGVLRKTVGVVADGLANVAAAIVHERKHAAIDIDLHNHPGFLLIGSARKNYSSSSEGLRFTDIHDFTNKLSQLSLPNIMEREYQTKVLDAVREGRFVTDFDGDGIDDDLERGRYRDEWNFSDSDPDTWNFRYAGLDHDPQKWDEDDRDWHNDYREIGDNEVLARDAEKTAAGMIDSGKDWSFPGDQIEQDSRGADANEWRSIRSQKILSYALFSSSSSRSLLKRAASGLVRNRHETSVLQSSFKISMIPDFVAKESDGGISIVNVASGLASLNSTALASHLLFQVAVTNGTGIDASCRISGWLVDADGEPVALAQTTFIAPTGMSETSLAFDGRIIRKSGRSGFSLRFIVLKRNFPRSVRSLQVIENAAETDRRYSWNEFVPFAAEILNDEIVERKTDAGLEFDVPICVAETGNYQITLSLSDENGVAVADTGKNALFTAMTNVVTITVPAETLYCSDAVAPYFVRFIKVSRDGSEIARKWNAYTSANYSRDEFRGTNAVLEIDVTSTAVSAKYSSSAGCDALSCRFSVTNVCKQPVSYLCRMIVSNTNGTIAAQSQSVKLISDGFSSMELSVGGATFHNNGVDGPYVVSEIVLEPVDGVGIKERFVPQHAPINLKASDFGGVPFTLKGSPVFRRATGKSPAALLVPLDVARPDTITASVMLTDGDGKYVAMARTNETVAVGERTLTLTFDPDAITASGRRGPYTISYLLLKSGIEGVEDVRIEDFKMLNVAESAFRAFVDLSDIVTTETTPVPVERTWLDDYPTMLETFSGDYEDMANATSPGASGSGKTWPDGSPCRIWQDYVAGTSPTNNDVFSASIRMDGATPVVEWKPDTPELRATRIYRTLGKKTLLDANWTDITGKDQSEYRFFKVTVEMP